MLLHTCKSMVAMATVHDCGFKLVDHPTYSPDLAPSDYFLYPNMIKHLAVKQYLQLRSFWRIRMRACIPWESKQCNTDGRSVWTTGETMLKYKPHFGQIQPLPHSQPMNFSAHPRCSSHINSLFATYKFLVCHIILERSGIGAPFWKYYFQIAVSFYL